LWNRFLGNIEQHSEGLDLATAQVDFVYDQGLHICAREALPGAEVVAYGYSPVEDAFAGGQILDSRPNFRLMHGHITRSLQYSSPGFGRTYSYELNMPMPNGIYGAPVIKPASNEVVGVIFGVLDMPKAGRLQSVNNETGSSKDREKQMMTFGLAHHTDNLQFLQVKLARDEQVAMTTDKYESADRAFGGTIMGLRRESTAPTTHENAGFPGNLDVEPEDKIDGNNEPSKSSTYYRIASRGAGVVVDILKGFGKLVVFSTGKLKAILIGTVTLRKQFDRIPEKIKARDEKAKAAEIERIHRRLTRYEARLKSEHLVCLKEQRRIIRELKLLFPTDDDSTSID